MDLDRASKMLSEQIRFMNRHLAVDRISLENFLQEEKPYILLKDGDKHYLNKKELEKLKNILPEEYHRRLRLPVYIEMGSQKYGRGAAKISGYPECYVVSKILGKGFEKDIMFIYRPEIQTLRKQLPTTTQYMFTVGVLD